MKKILVVCPTSRDYRELSYQGYEYNFIYAGHNPRGNLGGFDPVGFIDKTVARVKNKGISAVIGTHDYPGSIIASIISEKLGLCSVSTMANIICQHKYYSRLHQKDIFPWAVPEFKLVDPFEPIIKLPFDLPFFLKPVKSFFSIFATRIDTRDQYVDMLGKCRSHFSSFMGPFNKLIQKYSSLELDGNFLIAEKLAQGSQLTLEGYISDGLFEVIGITDSIMYPGSISFRRFDYPSRIAGHAVSKMSDIARKLLRHIGFYNGIFNIEFFYNPRQETIKIIEINPRMCSQFADLMEKVNGLNTYRTQLDIVLGIRPSQPAGGKYSVASSFVLRKFKDQIVTRLPCPEEIANIEKEFPEARIEIYGQLGKKLSCFMQDNSSYLYAIINLGAKNKKELFEKFSTCKNMLKFSFIDC